MSVKFVCPPLGVCKLFVEGDLVFSTIHSLVDRLIACMNSAVLLSLGNQSWFRFASSILSVRYYRILGKCFEQ